MAYLMEAFEEVNSCTLSLSMVVQRKRNKADIRLSVKAHTIRAVDVEPVLLASSDLFLSDGGYTDFGPAIMWALYLIDGQLADQEMNMRHNK